MRTLETIVVYYRVEDKIVPKIFEDSEKAKDFFDAVDEAVKNEQLKVEAE